MLASRLSLEQVRELGPILAAIRRAFIARHQPGGRSPAGFLLEIDMRQ
jgi:hypothetical protein